MTRSRREAFYILNGSDQPVAVEALVYHADREPVGSHRLTVAARRTTRIRFNHLYNPEPMPRGTSPASVMPFGASLVVQRTWLDPRQAANALRSMIAFSGAE